MRKLGDQWIEEIDGQEHMLKAVKPVELCQGCLFNCNGGGCWWKGFDDCQMGSFFIINDLGVLNKDGLLPCPFCGEYPVLKLGIDENGWHYAELRCCSYVDRMTGYSTDMEGFFKGMIERWNRRV